MQGKKALFLFLALLLPVGIFIFLRLFGKNEFEVPAFYQDKSPMVAECNFTYTAPYVVPDSVMARLAAVGKNELYLIHLSGDLSSRIKQEITDKEVTFVDGKLFENNVEQFRKCILLVPAQEDLIVVDSLGKIRGYYSSLEREEVDRLLLETKILLKKY
jgi:hypothetical protein